MPSFPPLYCDTVGRDYDEIEKTVMYGALDPGADGEKVDAMLDKLQRFADLGISEAPGIVPDVYKITPLELLGERVIPEAARM